MAQRSTIDPVVKLRSDVEKLSGYYPLWSRSGSTPRGTVHTQIINGHVGAEGDALAPAADVATMCDLSLTAATALRDAVSPDPAKVALIWRVEPYLNDGQLYMRLCFEPV